MRGYRIQFPGAPNLDLSPNRRDSKHWRSRYKAVAELTDVLHFDILARAVRPPNPLTGDLEYTAEICWGPKQRLLDFDGAVGVLKAYIDLLARADWMFDDKQIKGARITQRNSSEGEEYVEITVRPKE